MVSESEAELKASNSKVFGIAQTPQTIPDLPTSKTVRVFKLVWFSLSCCAAETKATLKVKTSEMLPLGMPSSACFITKSRCQSMLCKRTGGARWCERCCGFELSSRRTAKPLCHCTASSGVSPSPSCYHTHPRFSVGSGVWSCVAVSCSHQGSLVAIGLCLAPSDFEKETVSGWSFLKAVVYFFFPECFSASLRQSSLYV